MSRYSLMISYENESELKSKREKFDKLHGQVSNPSVIEALRKERIYLIDHELKKNAKTVFLFAGQSSAYSGMFSTLSKSLPAFREKLAQADAFCTIHGQRTLTEVIRDSSCEPLLAELIYSQMIPFTFQAATVDELGKQGIHPHIAIGHSVGEFGALYAARSITFEQGLQALWARYESVSQTPKPEHAARMMVVRANESTVRALIAGYSGVYLANVNAPDQTVIALYSDAMASLKELFFSNGVDAKELAITNGFHSPMMAPAVSVFEQQLKAIEFKKPQIQVTSLVSNDWIPSAEELPRLLSQALISPVRFKTLIDQAHQAGGRLYMDIGPTWTLKNLVESNWSGEHVPYKAFYTNHKKEDDGVTFDRFTEEVKLWTQEWPDTKPSSVPEYRSPNIISGDSRERGRMLGQLWKPHFNDYQWIMDRLPPEILDNESQAIKNLIEALPVECREELIGVAEALEVDTQIIHRISCLSSIVTSRYGLCFGAIVEKNNLLLHFANYDFPFVTREDAVRLHRHIVQWETPGRNSFLGVYKVGSLFPFGGVNEEGIAITASAGSPQGDLKNGQNVHLATREILETCATLEEVKQYCQSHTLEGAWTLMVSSKQDERGLQIEWMGNAVRFHEDSTLLSTNHFQFAKDVDQVREDSLIRLERLRQITKGLASVSEAVSILGDGYDLEKDRETKFATRNTLNRYNTSASILFDVACDEMWVSHESIPAGKGPYFRYRFGMTKPLHWTPTLLAPRSFDKSLDLPVVALIGDDSQKTMHESVAEYVFIQNPHQPSHKEFILLDLSEIGMKDQNIHSICFGRFEKKVNLLRAWFRNNIRIKRFVSVGFSEIPIAPVTTGERCLSFAATESFFKSLSQEYLSSSFASMRLQAQKGFEYGLQSLLKSERNGIFAAVGKDVVEVGYGISPIYRARTNFLPQSSDTYLITGGAGGITCEIGLEMARRFGGHYILIGRSVIDNQMPNWTQAEFFAHIRDMKPGLKPKEYAELWKKHQRSRQTYENVERYKNIGVSVDYVALDLLNAENVNKKFEDLKQAYGHIDHVIHGAGAQISRLFVDKTEEEFNSVFASKAHGTRNLLQALKRFQPKTVVLFSSVSGENGNRGQTDYAAANAVHQALPPLIKKELVGTRVKVISWPAWSGAGMAMEPSVHSEMTAAGVGFITVKEGINAFIEDFLSPCERSIWTAPITQAKSDKTTAAAGYPSHTEVLSHIKQNKNAWAMIDRVYSQNNETIAETFFSGREVFLQDHQVKGLPIVPGVVLSEMVLEASNALCGRTSVIQKIQFDNPCHASPQYGARVRIHFHPITKTSYSFKITIPKMRSDGAALLHEHVTAFGEISQENKKSMDELKGSIDESNVLIGKEEFYKKLLSRFQEIIGPSFYSLKSVLKKTKNYILILGEKTESTAFGHGRFVLHPALFDLMNHAVIEFGFIDEDEFSYLPYMFEGITVFKNFELHQEVFLVVNDFVQKDNQLQFSARFYGRDRQLLVSVDRITHRRFGRT